MAVIAPDGPYKMQKTLRKLFLIRLPSPPAPEIAVIAPNGPYEVQKTVPSSSLARPPRPPGPRHSPSLVGQGHVDDDDNDGPILVPPTVPCARHRARGRRTPHRGPWLLLGAGPVTRGAFVGPNPPLSLPPSYPRYSPS